MWVTAAAWGAKLWILRYDRCPFSSTLNQVLTWPAASPTTSETSPSAYANAETATSETAMRPKKAGACSTAPSRHSYTRP